MELKHFPISIQPTFQGLDLSYFDDEGAYYHMHYIGYTQDEALALFDEYLTDINVE